MLRVIFTNVIDIKFTKFLKNYNGKTYATPARLKIILTKFLNFESKKRSKIKQSKRYQGANNFSKK